MYMFLSRARSRGSPPRLRPPGRRCAAIPYRRVEALEELLDAQDGPIAQRIALRRTSEREYGDVPHDLRAQRLGQLRGRDHSAAPAKGKDSATSEATERSAPPSMLGAGNPRVGMH